MTRKKKLLAWSAAIALGLLVVVAIALAVLLGTSWGHDRLSSLVSSLGSGALNGSLSIGRIEGSLLSDFTIHDVVVRDESDDDVARIAKLRVAYDAGALVGGHVLVHDLEIDAPWARLETDDDGRTNFEKLLPPDPNPSPSEPTTLALTVERLRLDDGVFVQGPATKTSTIVESIALAMALDAPLPDVIVDLERLAAHVVDPPLDVALDADVALEAGVVASRSFRARVDGREILRLERARFDTNSLALDVAAALDVPAELVRKLSGQRELDAPFVATATASHDGPTGRWNVALDGALGDAPVTLEASFAPDFSELRAALEAKRIDPAALHSAAPKAKVGLTASAAGPLDSFTVTATVTARDVKLAPLAIDGASVVAHLTGVPSNIAGRGRIAATNVVVDGQRFGDTRFDLTVAEGATRFVVDGEVRGGEQIALPRLRAGVHLDGPSVVAEVEAIELRTRAIVWRGEEMTVRLDERGDVHLGGVRLRSRAGLLAASGVIVPSDPLRRSRDVSMTIEKLTLATFSKIAPGVPELDGAVDLQLAMNGRKASLELSGRALRIGDIDALSVEASAKLDGRALSADAKLDGARLGSADVSLNATTPEDPTDAAAWARAPLDRLAALEAHLVALDIAELGALLGIEELRAGRVDGTITAGARARKIDADVKAKGVLVAQLEAPLDADLELLATEARVAAILNATIDGRRIVVLDAWIDAGLPSLERRGLAAVEAADAHVRLDLERFAIERILELAATGTTTPPFTGILTGAAAIEKRGQSVEANIDLHADDVRVRSDAPPVDGRVTVDLQARELRTRIWVEGPDGLTARAQADVETPANVLDDAAWRALRVDQVRRITAKATRAKLGTIARIVGIELPPGSVSLSADVGPGLSSPVVVVDVRDVELGPTLNPFGAVLALDERAGRAHAELGVFVDDRPLAEATVHLGRSVRDLVEADPAELERLPLEGVVRSMPFDVVHLFRTTKMQRRFGGRLMLEGRVDGRLDALRASAHLALEEAELGGRRFEGFAVDAKIDGSRIVATVDAKQDDGGVLRLDAKMEDEVDVDVVAERFALDFVGELLQAATGSAFGLEKSRLDARIRASGSSDAPDVEGDFGLTAERVVVAAGVPALENADVRAELAGGRVTAKIRGLAGEGEVRVDAEATVFPPEALAFEATLVTKDVRASAGTTAALATLNIHAKGVREKDVLTIDVVSDGGRIELPGDPGDGELHAIDPMEDVVYVDEVGLAEQRLKERKEKNAEKGLQTIIRVRTKDALRIDGELLRTAVEASLDLRSTPKGFAIDGWISLPRGQITLIAHQYDIERARVVFDGQLPIDPRLDVVLTKQFSNAEFKVIVSGTSKKPELIFAADPAVYTRGELMQVFLGGEPGVESGGEVTPAQALSAAAGVLLGPVTRALRRTLPIDTLKFDVGEGSAGGNTAAVTLGKWLTDDLFLAYTFKVNESGTETTSQGLLRYRFTGTWIAELKYAQGQEGSAEVLWLKRF